MTPFQGRETGPFFFPATTPPWPGAGKAFRHGTCPWCHRSGRALLPSVYGCSGAGGVCPQIAERRCLWPSSACLSSASLALVAGCLIESHASCVLVDPTPFARSRANFFFLFLFPRPNYIIISVIYTTHLGQIPRHAGTNSPPCWDKFPAMLGQIPRQNN